MTSDRPVDSPRQAPARRSPLAWIGLILALAALLLGAASGLGHRAGLWTYSSGFALLGVAVLAGLAALVLSLVATVSIRRQPRPRPPLWPAAVGAAAGALLVALPAKPLYLAMTLPRIHDISTDTTDPPAFIAIAPLRAEAPNPPGYAGAAVASQQHVAYPRIVPHVYRADRHVVFDEAQRIVLRQGWRLVAGDPAAGRIEASAVSRWFGFVDDVAIRVTETTQGTRVDLRSKSRVGQSDLGANANRIEAFLAELDTRLGR